ncbi:MAG: restriction endonuclease [Clostridia bacterium]|nr:restriction endonuclease [Clostridia bacterium]
MDFIIDKFYEKMAEVKFDAFGILDSNNYIHTLGTDSKIIGRIFEMFAQPILEEIAAENGYRLKTPESQTVYPDFVMLKSEESKEKIAIDIKTTYIDSDNSTIKFTLGSFGSYMRNNTKNIEYKYTDYTKHYVIGFVYKRNDAAQESRVYKYEDRNNIAFPYYDVKYFIVEKYKIAGDKPGSGNTENIGSFATRNFLDLKNGRGPFSELGQDVFDIYWKYYPKYRATNQEYTSLSEFLRWLPVHIDSVELLHAFDKQSVLESIEKYKAAHKNI